MEYINSCEFRLENSNVTIGKFDGVHIGHRKLLAELTKRRQEKGGKAVVFTFDFHPAKLFVDEKTKLLYTEEEKRALLEEAGVDILIGYPFTKETSSMEAEDFIREVIQKKMDTCFLAVGPDNRFGHNRRGDVQMLQDFSEAYGYEAVVCDKVQYEGEEVSSTRIRKELEDGNMESANAMLGRPFHVSGMVEKGKQLGRKYGFPTINLIPPVEKLLPPNGVYAAHVIMDCKKYCGVANIGLRPTVGEQDRIWVETNIFDYSDDCYGKSATVELVRFMRPEQNFGSVEMLMEQIGKDKENTRRYFEEINSMPGK